MTQPDRNLDKRWQHAISVILRYKVKLERLWLRKLYNNRPRKLKVQSIATASLDSDNKLHIVHVNNSSSRKCKPASLTKVMAVITALDEIGSIDERITVEAEDILPGSRNNLKAGDKISWKDAFHNMLMASSNSSANTVIRSLGLRLPSPEPCTRPNASAEAPACGAIAAMNAKAQSLGMTGTRFTNASGLDSYGMYTTAHDMLLMGVAALAYPDLTKAWGKTVHIMKVGGPSARDVEITSTLKQLFDEEPVVG
ncbi:serine hydrolase [Marinobacter sp. 71-i]|uniref:Serine hydrolase n=1 Tax=Marinobacter iranensis TaxID=2962607 RepID=A0ABT5Y9W3_9GAMM|nr:serine hydrolase [Marinobacter iranensis]MDF0750468.1 serine hydrolase [Marinobacter iranensis]